MIGVVVDLINIIRNDLRLAREGARQILSGFILFLSAITVALLATASIPLAPMIWIAERSHQKQNK